MLKQHIFREYDIRGLADRDLPNEAVELMGKAVGSYLIRHSGYNVFLGRDCRLSGERIHAAFRKGLAASGAQVSDIGIVPTPVLYYSALHFKADGAVMITGGNHAPDFNGMKIVCGSTALYGDQLQQIAKLLQNGDFETGAGALKEVDAVTPYVDEIAAQFRFENKIKVVFDAANGTAGPVLARLIEKLNIDVTELYFDIDGNFPNHPPDPTSLPTLKPLKAAVKANKADLGIAFDSDGDRVGVVDENGEVIYGDMLLLIFGREILTRKPGATFLSDARGSQAVYDKLKELGGNPVMAKAGHALVKAKMKETNAELAGEMSGHMFFSDRYYGYDDALYTACRLIEIVAKSGKPLSHQLSGVKKLVSTPELRVACPDDKKFAVVAKVGDQVRKDYPVVETDGIRAIFDSGWGLVRASTSQPALVMRFEATTDALLKKYRDYLEGIIEKARKDLGAQ